MTYSLEYGSESPSGTIEFDDNVNIASGLVTSAIDRRCFGSKLYLQFSAKLVLMLGTLQSERLSGIDGEYVTSVVRGSSIHPSIVPVGSMISNFECLPHAVLRQPRSSYLHNGDRQFVQE
jgi:hypothetical protein